jgi:hypothetical protein
MKHNPHKWAEVIKAWADGEYVQFRLLKTDYTWTGWMDYPIDNSGIINWDNPDVEFRIKPEGE